MQHGNDVSVEAFCAAAAAGDVATVRRLAKARPELVNLGRGGAFGEQTALHFAVLNRDGEMTCVLMELGSDARIGVWPHRDATSAMTIAKERGYEELVAIIEQAEERRRKERSPAGATSGSKTGEFHKAILEGRRDDAIRILESDLSLAGACNNDGAMPLHVAAWKHDPEMARWLLDHGASADARAPFDVPPRGDHNADERGYTPLDYAAIVAGWSAHGREFCFVENSRVEPVRFYETVDLLRGKGAELTPRAAVAIGDREAVLQLHRAGRLDNDIHFFRGGLLSIAVRVNRIEIVSLLLDLGLDPDESVNVAAADGIARSWGMPLWFCAMCGRHEIAERLLARGADVNAVVYACGDALCTADKTEDSAMKSLLLEHGARITVEHIAGYGDRETAQAILDGKIPAQSLNVDNPSLTQLAEQMLWAAGSRDAEIVRMCLHYIAREPDDPWWNYVLMHAALPDSFKLILEHGVDPDVGGDESCTILHHLATTNVDEEHRITFATMLLDAGASLSRRDPLLKSTPLGWACRWGRIDLVQFYLQRGADAVEENAEPWATPLAWADKGRHSDIISLLRSHVAK